MANIWNETNDRNNNVHVNGYDWSHQSNFTGRLGYLYPFFTDLVPAHSSFRCSPKLGLQFMPMVFPVQTRMKARVSFFRMPLRALWKDYKDYVGNFRPNLEEPYHDLATSFDKFMGTGKLADYLDIPTVLYGDYGTNTKLNITPVDIPRLPSDTYDGAFKCVWFVPQMTIPDGNSLVSSLTTGQYMVAYVDGDAVPKTTEALCYAAFLNVDPAVTGQFSFDSKNSELLRNPLLLYYFSTVPADSPLRTMNFSFHLIAVDSRNVVRRIVDISDIGTAIMRDTTYPANLGEGMFAGLVPTWNVPEKFTFASGEQYLIVASLSVPGWGEHPTSDYDPLITVFGAVNRNWVENFSLAYGLNAVPNGYQEITRASSPYYDSTSPNKDKKIKLNAYAARTYEAIYNAYMRDNRNNPYYRNGQVEYNVWIPTDEGGADTYPYELHRANWEKDFLTTAVPSPQQGRAPLVGLTTYTDTETTDGVTTTALKVALVDEDGKRYAVNMKTNEDGVVGVDYAELPEGSSMSPLSFRSLVDASTTGISIPDLRMVNAYQKFLELNMRKGYSYKQIVEGRFDCQVRYDDLNMPEFIGGFTRDVSMNRVVQSVEKEPTEQYPEGSYANALGSLAGDAFLAADGPTISCYCDEESIIMGIISIVPVPNYSQLLPKHYLYRDLLDHFQPEFDNLGFQPITYKEVCPLQTYASGDDLDAVFGYQRPWYEYVQKTDKVHGLFRTNLRNFLMNRVFDSKPALTQSFLLVDDEQLNDVFAVTENTDKIIGQIWLDCSVKLPISRVAIPRLD